MYSWIVTIYFIYSVLSPSLPRSRYLGRKVLRALGRKALRATQVAASRETRPGSTQYRYPVMLKKSKILEKNQACVAISLNLR